MYSQTSTVTLVHPDSPSGLPICDIVLYRTGGAGSRLRKYTIGSYGRVTLHQARVTALKIFAARAEGKDPAAEKQQARRRLVVDRVDDLVELFINEHLSTKRSEREISRMLRREVLPKWGARSVHEIGKREVIDLVYELTARGTPSAANKLLKVIKTFFGWCVGRAILDVSPAGGLAAPAKETARDRVLNDDELADILRAARQIGGPYGGIVELLALSGQRREEVAQLTWDEIDLASQTWTLPASRAKNGKLHIVHLSKAAISVLMRMPRLGRYFGVMGPSTSKSDDRCVTESQGSP
ncbi:MAG TPA: tyrosine-type recombinase/integrase [Methyloceanibacter sp.]|nr:tyrosine-type recombinase/integrase [Methyloceanibacter sp.]